MRFRTKGTSVIRRAFAGRRPRVTLAIAAASLLGLTMTSVVQAAPANATPEYFSTWNVHSLDCMSNGGVTNGVVTQYSCNGSNNQSWYFGSAHGAYQQIKNRATNQCVGLAGGSLANGKNIQMGTCSSNDMYYWQKETPCFFLGMCPPGVLVYQNQASLRIIQVACGCDTNSATLNDETPNSDGPPAQLWYWGS